MKALLLISTLAMSLSANAYVGRRTEYRCSGRGASIAVVSDTERSGLNIVGTIRGKEVDYWSRGTRRKDVYVYADRASDVEVQIQPAGPYDGGQDALWGGATDGKGKIINMTCYIGMGDSF